MRRRIRFLNGLLLWSSICIVLISIAFDFDFLSLVPTFTLYGWLFPFCILACVFCLWWCQLLISILSSKFCHKIHRVENGWACTVSVHKLEQRQEAGPSLIRTSSVEKTKLKKQLFEKHIYNHIGQNNLVTYLNDVHFCRKKKKKRISVLI